jgi:methyl-accepting chemotaxis protein
LRQGASVSGEVRGDDLMLGVILLHTAAAAAIGWPYARLDAALAIGLPLLGAAGALWFLARGRLLAHVGLALIAMALVALQIHVGVGQNLFHFGVFVTLAILLIYRDWRIVVLGAAAIAVHHALFNVLQQAGWGVSCFTQPGWGQVVMHAAYVVAQTAVEVWIANLLAFEARQAQEVRRLADSFVMQDGRVNLDLKAIEVRTRLAGMVAGAFSHMRAAVEQVHSAASRIQGGSADIARGNTDLSTRTEQQASALQQTASSMEELASTSKQNAENARQASELAAGASAVASRGGEVVRKVVATMDGISSSSKKISDIIGVIDGIAFQTNILALNASVEAARAGEQGRGFAVVASEVRDLAQRSAAAAKEIKALIEDSVTRVEDGAKLVDAAGKNMDEMLASVQRVTDIVSEIASASGEQLSGIEQVGNAVQQMDRVVQQNASLVEQSASSAQDMAVQADVLMQAMSRFALEGRQAPAGATERRAPAVRGQGLREASYSLGGT